MRWSLADIDWSRLDRSAVDAELIAAVKTAALVEANSADYVIYLRNVFHDDSAFIAAAEVWGEEEAQHGAALGRWAEMVDSEFDFAASLARFRAGYQLPLDVQQSVRGSPAGELLARCVVESGTCSFYSAMRDHANDPVLRQICQFIAHDEAHHYQLFKTHYARYPRLAWWKRVRIALGRVNETSDDELGYAWYSANTRSGATAPPYDRAQCAGTYQRIATSMYREQHVLTVIHMIATALGVRSGNAWVRLVGRAAWRWLRWQNRAYKSPALEAGVA